MTTYILTYRAPRNYQGTAETQAAWRSWFESMGTNVVDQGNPVFKRSTLGSCATDTVLGGYSLLTANDLEAAVALAKGCPFLQQGGGVEVGELATLS